MSISPAERLDTLNIGLMLVSCIVAMIIPFELFLFSYAVLGPLHYLTEISWLHDKQYYTKGKWDAVWLMVIGLLITLAYFNQLYNLELGFPPSSFAVLGYIALFSALVMVLVKNTFYRIAGIVLVCLTYLLSQYFVIFLTVFLPTLVHVYVFTGLFMLYGALKSKSKMGIVAVVVLALCPVILFTVFPTWHPIGVTQYGQSAYIGEVVTDTDSAPQPIGFFGLNMTVLNKFFGVGEPGAGTNGFEYWFNAVFHSRSGILLARFIAFAYTYHYLNWFSKTRIIQWHKVPKVRFAIVIVIWIASVGLYLYNYAVGLQWLFFLSFLHVLLEFPLNYTSIIGIGRFFGQRISKPTAQRA